MDFKQLIRTCLPWLAAPLSRAGIQPGLYHYVREADGRQTRFHLRVDSTGNGMLMADASAAARLRTSGVIVAKGLLEGDNEPTIVARLRESFRNAEPEQAAADVKRVRAVMDRLQTPGDNYPILNRADPSLSPEKAPLEMPVTADVPLANRERIEPILDRLWELGIPHVTFVAGRDPDTASLVRLVERAEDLGLITGVRAQGSVLAKGSLVDDLAQVGLDHANVLYLCADPTIHDALAGSGDHEQAVRTLAALRENDVCPLAEVALVESTFEVVEETIESLVEHDVVNAAFYALAMAEGKSSGGALPAGEVVRAAELVERSAEEADVRFLWYPPVRFHLGASLAREVRRGPRSSGDSAVRIESDGSVFPARGPCRPAGNLLKQSWRRIRAHESYRKYRRRVETDTHCDECPGLVICTADCPRDPDGWADGRGKGCDG